jgi:DNA-binding NarL/FixJ family response regulator
VNDYEVVVRGLATLLAPFADRVRVVELRAGDEPRRRADVALFDTFGGRRHTLRRVDAMVRDGHVDHVVLYTWDASASFLNEAEHLGVAAVIPKSTPAGELVALLEQVARGGRVPLDAAMRPHPTPARSADQLSVREREVLALLSLGLTNRAIADELYLSADTVKTYVRRLYTKLGVRNRAQAATRAAALGLDPPSSRLVG